MTSPHASGAGGSGAGAGDVLRAFTARWLPAVEAALEDLVPAADEPPAELHAAMRHAMFPGGKRFRPILALLAARACGADDEVLRRDVVGPAAGLELLHTYSLVHDDLPCMDDDDLRRGRPTCHKVFGEATALLAGDALLTLAFQAVAPAGPTAVQALARGAGSRGMVGGQVGDLAAERSAGGAAEAPAGAGLEEFGAEPIRRVEWIHDRKTGALIRASLVVGAAAVGADPAVLRGFEHYGELVGRAFQIADDCLDLTGTAAELGKQPGQDLAHEKLTYPAVLGLERSRAAAENLADRAAKLVPELVASAAGDRVRPVATAVDDPVRLLQDVPFHVVARKA